MSWFTNSMKNGNPINEHDIDCNILVEDDIIGCRSVIALGHAFILFACKAVLIDVFQIFLVVRRSFQRVCAFESSDRGCCVSLYVEPNSSYPKRR